MEGETIVVTPPVIDDAALAELEAARVETEIVSDQVAAVEEVVEQVQEEIEEAAEDQERGDAVITAMNAQVIASVTGEFAWLKDQWQRHLERMEALETRLAALEGGNLEALGLLRQSMESRSSTPPISETVVVEAPPESAAEDAPLEAETNRKRKRPVRLL